jgi:hypothetical protein
MSYRMQEIERLLSLAATAPDGAFGTAAATAAQVHATLHLAEQQHTANLLAALGSGNALMHEGWVSATAPEAIARIEQRNAIRAQIREGLGVA